MNTYFRLGNNRKPDSILLTSDAQFIYFDELHCYKHTFM